MTRQSSLKMFNYFRPGWGTHTAIVLLAFLLTFQQPGQAAESATPWRLASSLGLNQNLKVGGTQRTRIETLNNNIKSNSGNNDDLIVTRTLLDVEYSHAKLSTQLEFADSRQWQARKDSLIGNDTVNTLDVLQANLSYHLESPGPQMRSDITVGRFTMNYGSRRLLARNNFRNTISAFEGLELSNHFESGTSLRSFLVRPVTRLPFDRAAVLNNEREVDEGNNDLQLLGVHAALPQFFTGLNTEIYAIDLQEKDVENLESSSRGRDFWTAGIRIFKAPEWSRLDFELESIFQYGERSATLPGGIPGDIDHRAYFHYVMLGYSFDDMRSSRIQFEFDYASGDKDFCDNASQRFDSLFGATSFEFGPSSLYGLQNRGNLISPAVRLTNALVPTIELMTSYRHYWLESDSDSWGRTGLRDITGSTDRYMGQQLEMRLRWQVYPNNWLLEFGSTFMDASGLSDRNSRFVHLSSLYTF